MKRELIANIKSLAREVSQEWPHEEMVKLPDVLKEIDQLDEPEVLSQDKKSGDLVNHPSHYQGLKGLEVREVMENFVPKYDQYGGLVSCDIKDAIKYILRAPDKNGLEDLQKAQRMIKYAIDSLEGEGDRV